MFVAVVVVPIQVVGNLASLFSLLGFIVVNLTVVKLRRDRPDMTRPFEVPFYPFAPVLGIVLNLLLGPFIGGTTWLLALGWLALGAVVYLVLTRVGESAERQRGRPGDRVPTSQADPEDD